MSYIFRSDAVRVGDRVVVRRIIPGGHSDVIGHVEALQADTIVLRPQSVGGYPSDLPTISIAQADIAIIKKLSPRRIRNSEIRALEKATAAAFPGVDHRWTSDGQWLLRAGDGITERSNSAAPLGASAGLAAVPWDEITAFYKQHDLPAQLLLPERIARTAEARCQPPEWEFSPEILVMTRDLSNASPNSAEPGDATPGSEGFSSEVPGSETQLPAGFVAQVSEQPDAEWLARYHFRGEPLPAPALALLQRTIDGTLGFGCIKDATTGGTVAITRGTITDGYLGFSAVEVDPEYRRRGLGQAMGRHMLTWGASLGAHTAYLQVISTNTAGIQLYKKLGFVEHHRHRYATLVASRDGAEPPTT